ncbi:hypothetical protein [Nitrosospira sp. NRS527]|uniref:hypothetical protein n=1 Tax=Nitrosospira sp. NRS527 TaxID=155925 RepID=UPI001AF16472|nr:hypothetical protein [Nitrosospira sp. NRS527]BCT69591.1 hypothetical protein NNRS527_03216 [Nitrosospira sp. NRS527]
MTKKNDLVEKEIRVNVPRPLARKEVRDAISFGLFRLAGGSKPQNIPDGAELVTARVKLNATALKYLPLGIAKVGDERTAIIHALAWLAEQREHVWLIRI